MKFSAAWSGFCYHIRAVPQENIFDVGGIFNLVFVIMSAVPQEDIFWIFLVVSSRINVFIPRQKYYLKPQSSWWFSGDGTAVIAHLNFMWSK